MGIEIYNTGRHDENGKPQVVLVPTSWLDVETVNLLQPGKPPPSIFGATWRGIRKLLGKEKQHKRR